MARSDAQRDRQQYRKTQQMLDQTHTVPAGRSIIEMIREQLDEASTRYVLGMTEGTQKEVLIARGEIRGLARAVALMQNPYYPTRAIKQIEKDSVERAKERLRARQQQDATQAEEREDGKPAADPSA